jgi:DNA-binding MurR/RpiR family transcriptional regulator
MKPPSNPIEQFDSVEGIPHRCLVRLRGIYPSLKTAEKKAVDYLLRAPGTVRGATIIEFADQAGCSEATAVRLARKLGYEGYPELKADLGHAEATVPYRDIDAADAPEEVARKVFANSLQALQDTLGSLDVAQYREAVDAMLKARRLAFIGLGNAAVVAREAYQKFLRIGVPSFTAEDSDLQLIIINAQLQRGDLLTAISYSGDSKPIIAAAEQAQARGIKVLAITNYPRSTLARLADTVLLTAVFQPFVNGEIASKRLAQLCVLESLYVNYLLRQSRAVRGTLEASNQAIAINKRHAPANPPPTT